MNCDEPYKLIRNINIMELKSIIKECLREFKEEKKFSDKEYKALWEKAPAIIEDLRCG